MSELTPITRIESYLDAIVNSGIPPTEDITRIETFLQAIYDNQVCALTPITRIEMFFGKISGQDIVLPEPITRIELYLAAIAGEDVELPENPITRLEMYLAEWADSGDWTTISGAIVEFITQRAHKLKSCVVNLEPQQDLSHGDPSPTNICPISGWTGVSVWDCGKNLYNPAETEQNKWVGENGEETVSGFWLSGYIFLKAGTTYYRPLTGSVRNAYYSLNKEFKSYFTASGAITPQEDCYIRFVGVEASYPADGEIQFEIGSTATDYEPYQGNSYSVTWQDTVFGGSAEVVEGVRRKTLGEVDLGSLIWNKFTNATKTYFQTQQEIPDMKKSTGNGIIQPFICSRYKTESWSHTLDYSGYNCTICEGYKDHSYIAIYDEAFVDVSADAFKTAMSGVQLVYELATPVETTITPTPITALSGYNAMWSDGGDIEVTVKGTPVELSTLQALNMLLGGAYHNEQTADDVSDEEALDIILGGENE